MIKSNYECTSKQDTSFIPNLKILLLIKLINPYRIPFLFPFLSVSDFTENLAQLYEQHAEALQVLVSGYRKRNGELRKERLVSCFALQATVESGLCA